MDGDVGNQTKSEGGMRRAIAMCLLLVGCELAPISTEKTNNPAALVDFLFEHEGCRVFRFEDNGRYHYFTSCPGSAISTRRQQMGKQTVIRDEEVPTGVRP